MIPKKKKNPSNFEEVFYDVTGKHPK